MSSILFTDADGTWRLHNGKPWGASRFASWTPQSAPFGDAAPRQSDGALTMFRLRDDFGVTFELPMIPSVRISNALRRPEELDNGTWTKTGVVINANSFTAPDGSPTADRMEEDGSIGTHVVGQTVAGLVDNTLYTLSWFVRRVDRPWVILELVSKDGTARRAYFDIANLALGTSSGISTRGIMPQDPQGFIRLWIVATSAAGGTTPVARLYSAQADGADSYTGSVGATTTAWGAQLEANGGNAPSPFLRTADAQLSNVSMVEIADRLKYHLLNGGTCSVYPNDAASSAYATCGLTPGTVPQLSLSDRRALEYTLSLQLTNIATAPVRMLAHYAGL